SALFLEKINFLSNLKIVSAETHGFRFSQIAYRHPQPSLLKSHIKEAMIKLGYHLLCFFIYLYSMILALIND
uniref:Uncharacterized protein n=1 Tax=Oryzias sinensis TaxID=183150 RepID=A0A8C7WZ14_9TELE